MAPNAAYPEHLASSFGRLRVLDDLIRQRASDKPQEPILAYPQGSGKGLGTYDYFNGQDLDRMVEQAARGLIQSGLQPCPLKRQTVALLTLSDLNMVVTLFALSRLGYSVMLLSPRLPAKACVSLLNDARCGTILYGPTAPVRATLGEVLKLKLVTCCPIRSPSLDAAAYQDVVAQELGGELPQVHESDTAVILHSSGSTGLPKPLYLSHSVLISQALQGRGLSAFNSLPWYHGYGDVHAKDGVHVEHIRADHGKALVEALTEAQPESVHCVPYVLQLLVDEPGGVDALRACKLVTFGGAACPDELGNRLVAEDVRFGGLFGSMEAGLVAESISRPLNDRDWSYLNFFDHVSQFTKMEPITKDLYECVYLPGHPSLSASNAGDGAYRSRDVFSPHPYLPNRWKYICRLDDQITLVNGEKVRPLPMEGTVRQHPFVQEAVVVGIQRAVPGLLVFRSDDAKDLDETEVLDHVGRAVEDANSRAEQFAQISRGMIKVLPAEAVCPRADKGSMIRAQVYRKFAATIDGMYRHGEAGTGVLLLGTKATEDHILGLCQKELRRPITAADDDLYAKGMDSLQAIHLRQLILRDFHFPRDTSLSPNFVYEMGSVSRLAERICAIQRGQHTAPDDPRSLAHDLVRKYSSFPCHTSGPSGPSSPRAWRGHRAVVLTGATGSVGAHLLETLMEDDTVATIYCLTRHPQPREAILGGLRKKNLSVLESRVSKIVALESDQAQPDLGVGTDILRKMKQSVSLILHTAWPVNFALPLSSFEAHIHGLSNLIHFSLSVESSAPAVLLFCSSVSTALGAPASHIDEKPLDLDCALPMGYSQSKWVGEKIVSHARRMGVRAYSLRIGQVSGHSEKGLWNDSEAIPLMIRSALTLQALPDMDSLCSWLPVDQLAKCIVEIAESCLTMAETDVSDGVYNSVYNVVNPGVFPWSAVLDALQQEGLQFKTVPFSRWLQLLKDSEARGEAAVNPAVKLIEHYQATCGPSAGKLGKSFAVKNSERDSDTFSNNAAEFIESGILRCYARDWLTRWKLDPSAQKRALAGDTGLWRLTRDRRVADHRYP